MSTVNLPTNSLQGAISSLLISESALQQCIHSAADVLQLVKDANDVASQIESAEIDSMYDEAPNVFAEAIPSEKQKVDKIVSRSREAVAKSFTTISKQLSLLDKACDLIIGTVYADANSQGIGAGIQDQSQTLLHHAVALRALGLKGQILTWNRILKA